MNCCTIARPIGLGHAERGSPRDEQPVYIERRDHKTRIPLNDSVDVDQRDNKARATAVGVLEDAQQVLVDADRGRLERVKDCERRAVRNLIKSI